MAFQYQAPGSAFTASLFLPSPPRHAVLSLSPITGRAWRRSTAVPERTAHHGRFRLADRPSRRPAIRPASTSAGVGRSVQSRRRAIGPEPASGDRSRAESSASGNDRPVQEIKPNGARNNPRNPRSNNPGTNAGARPAAPPARRSPPYTRDEGAVRIAGRPAAGSTCPEGETSRPASLPDNTHCCFFPLASRSDADSEVTVERRMSKATRPYHVHHSVAE